MQNPLELPAPTMEQPILRVKEYARDLAYGALMGYWNAELPESTKQGDALWNLRSGKWHEGVPAQDLLVSFGYLVEPGGPGHRRYILTQKAHDLLENIPPKTTVFISYSRKKSSAFALAIQYKLASLGVTAFLDRDIDLGDEWHARLEGKIKSSDYFIVLLAPGTLNSEITRKEIHWAWKAERACIPIWCLNFSLSDDLTPRTDVKEPVKKYISGKNAYVIMGDESAMAYHNAVESIINRL